jgi:thiol-disulfide isomerase/thioredoxin
MRNATLVLLVIALLAACKGREAAAPATKTEPQTAAQRGAEPSADAGSEVGHAMPEYAALYLDGNAFDLATRRDKVVLLNLWATWCGPCRAEIPELQQIHDKYAAQGFEVIGVSVDETGPEAVKEFVTEHKMTYPVVLDAEGKLANIFQTSVLPTSVIVDRKGKIIWKKLGLIMPNDPELTKVIEAAL